MLTPESRVGDLDAVAVCDCVTEPLGVALDRVLIDMKSVLVLENPFTGVKRILRSMKQTEVGNGLDVVVILAEQFRDVILKSASAVRTFVELDVDSDSLKTLAGNESSEVRSQQSFSRYRRLLQWWVGTRLGRSRPVILS